MPYLPNRILRGIQAVIGGDIEYHTLCRLVVVTSLSFFLFCVLRVFGGESHHASIVAGEGGLISWIAGMIILIFAEVGRKPGT